MQQAQKKQDQIRPVDELAKAILGLANAIFDMDSHGYDDCFVSPDGTTIKFQGGHFHYWLSEMYQNGEVTRDGECSITLPNAGDDGDTNEITIESIEYGDQCGVVIYDVWQPATYSDEDWVCGGSLTLIRTTAENHDHVVKEQVDKARKDAMATAKSLAIGLLKGAADKPEYLAGLVKDVLLEIVGGSRWEFDKNADGIKPRGDIDTARSVVDAGREAEKVLDRSWAGAYIAELLHQHPLVESFTLHFSTSQEYDDNNYFTAHNLSLSGLVFVNNVPSVVMEDMEGEEYDPDRYLDMLDDQIKMQDCAEYDLHEGFCGVDAEDDFKVTVSRERLKDWLSEDVVDGLVVANIIMQTLEEE